MIFQKQKAFIEAVKSNNLSLFKDLLNDPDIIPSGNFNHILCTAAVLGHYEITDILLHHKSFNAHHIESRFTNTIRKVYKNRHVKILKLLLSEEIIVRNLEHKFLKVYKNSLELLIKKNIKEF